MSRIFTSHFSLEEESGLRTDDADGNHLTIINEAGRRLAQIQYGTNFKKYVPQFGGSLHTMLTIKDEDLYGIDTTGPWSAFAWFDSDVPFTDNFILSKYNDSQKSWCIRIAYNQLRFETSTDNTMIDVSFIAKPSIQQGNTKGHMVGVSYNPLTKSKNIFFDGILYEGTALHDGPLYNGQQAFTVGAMSDGGRNFDGWIDQVGILQSECLLEDWLFIWNDSEGRRWDEYNVRKNILHNKLCLISLSFDTPIEYTGCIPGEGENEKVEGSKKFDGFNVPVVVPPLAGYSFDIPDEYTGCIPGEGEE